MPLSGNSLLFFRREHNKGTIVATSAGARHSVVHALQKQRRARFISYCSMTGPILPLGMNWNNLSVNFLVSEHVEQVELLAARYTGRWRARIY